MIIRLAETQDLEQILAVYAPYIKDTAITFETVVPDLPEFCQRFEAVTGSFPWLVCAEGDQILGYAYAAKHRDRIAYQWSVESSVYLGAGAQGRGMGKKLYKALIDLLTLQGIVNVYGLITTPNEKSVGLHRSLGFNEFALFEKIGYKRAAWHDVQWMLLVINQHLTKQADPVPFPELILDIRVQKILREANQHG